MKTLAWDRQARIHALAWSLPDVAPAPSGARYADSRRGVAPSRWDPCRACLHGVVRDKWGHETACAVCGGVGRVKVDAYTLDVVGTELALAPARTRRVLCDRCGGDGVWKQERCDLCAGSGSRTVADTRTAAPIARARFVVATSEIVRLREAGSYDELEHAAGTVRALEPQAFAAWLQVRVHGSRSELDAGGWLRAADRLIDAEMPRRVLVPGMVREAWLRVQDGSTRDERIRSLARRGVGCVAIAETVGCSVRTVQRVLYARRAA